MEYSDEEIAMTHRKNHYTTEGNGDMVFEQREESNEHTV